ncbi:hypothetical protein ACNPM8_09550 [Glutamicibacter sp. AGC46]
MTEYRPGSGSRTDYKEVMPGDVPRGEFLLSGLQQQCLPLPDVDSSISTMQRALGYSTRKMLSNQDLRNLALDYLLVLRGVELGRASQNSAISNVASAVVALWSGPAIEQSIDDVLLAIHAYFWLENTNAVALLESLER